MAVLAWLGNGWWDNGGIMVIWFTDDAVMLVMRGYYLYQRCTNW